ncbi:transcriptional regulator [Micromonospora rosaria]|uniref:Transcriptional regulator n=2 Tax=Micromonospora rosaria TaxID=47874 RepID=A0A136PP13_9ACTN|nr:transcriptional regulator [Micromonospora rosaria]
MRHRDLVRAEWPHGTFLQRLDPAARSALLRLGTERPVPPGQILIHEGDHESHHLVLLVEGLAKVTVGLADGRSALLSLRVGGDLLGEMSALNQRARSATVTTCGPTRYRAIPRDQFNRFLREQPQAAVELAAMVSDRLRWSNRRRVDFALYGTRVRVARVIADLCRTHGRRTPTGVIIDVRLPQPELASICGASVASVEKSLRELRASGLVETDYRRLTVRDLPGLRALGELDPEDGLDPGDG